MGDWVGYKVSGSVMVGSWTEIVYLIPQRRGPYIAHREGPIDLSDLFLLTLLLLIFFNPL